MAKIDFDIVLKDAQFRKAIESAIQTANKLQKSLDKTDIPKRAQQGVKRFNTNLGQVVNNSRKLESNLRRTGKEASRMGGFLSGALAVGKGFVLVKFFLTLKNAVAGAVKTFAEFENSMLQVKTLLDDASFGTKDLNDGFKELSKDTLSVIRRFPVEIEKTTKALFDIVSAGVEASKATEALAASAQLAVAGVTDISTAADGITSVLNAYGEEAGETTQVAAKFFTAQKFGKTTVDQLSKSFGLAGTAAKTYGVGLNELLAATSAVTTQGVKTNTAFVGFDALLKNITKPSEKAKKIIQDLGLDLRDTFSLEALQSQGLTKFFQNLIKQTGGSKDVLNQLIGSVRGVRVAFALASEQGGEKYLEILEALNDETSTLNTFNRATTEQIGSLSNQWEQLIGQLKATAAAIGEVFAPFASGSLRVVNGFVKIVTEGFGNAGNRAKQLKDRVQDLQREFNSAGEDVKRSADLQADGLERILDLTFKIQGLSASQGFDSAQVKALRNELDPLLQKYEEAFYTEEEFQRRLQARQRQSLLDIQARTTAEQEAANKRIKALNAEAKIAFAQAKRSIGSSAFGAKVEEANKIKAIEEQLQQDIFSIRKGFTERGLKLSADAVEAIEQLEITANSKIASILEKRLKEVDSFYDKVEKASSDVQKIIAESEGNLTKVYEIELENRYKALLKQQKEGLLTGEEVRKAYIAIEKDLTDKLTKELDQRKDEEEEARRKRLEGWSGFASAAEGLLDGILDLDYDKMKEGFADVADSILVNFDSIADSIGSVLDSIVSKVETSKTLIEAQRNLSELQSNTTIPQQVEQARQRVRSAQDSSGVEDAERDLQAAISTRVNVTPTTSPEEIAAQRERREAQIRFAEERLRIAKQAQNTELATAKENFERLNKERKDSLKEAQEAVKAAEEARNKAVRDSAVDVLSSLGGRIVGPLIELAAQGPEAVEDFFNAFTEQLPVIIETLVEALPAVIDALVDAMPEIAEALAFAIPQVVVALISKVPEITMAVMESMARASVALVESVFLEIESFFGDFVDGLSGFADQLQVVGDTFHNLMEPIRDLINTITNIGKGGGGFFSDGGSVGGVLGQVGGAVSSGFKSLGLATGGQVVGQGNKDTVPAMLTPGELVVDRSTGPKLMDFIDSFQSNQGQPQTSSEGTEILLAELINEVKKPLQTSVSVELDGEVLADVILNLNRENKRIS